MERLQKVIARAGVASRRAAEEIILAGRVRVNGRVITELGAKADPHNDKIEVDGKRLVSEAPVYFAFHKPRNVVSTLHDPEGRPAVADYLRDVGARVYPVGRLDFATSGLLLVTNDGDFANALLHPRGGVPKTYVVKTHGVMSQDDLDKWRQGVMLDDGLTLPAEVKLLRYEGDKTWFEVSLREGRNQQIRRMGDATGFQVMRLARTSFAGITSEGLRPGESRPLTTDELIDLRDHFGVPKRVRRAADPAPPAGRPRAARGPSAERRPRKSPPKTERAGNAGSRERSSAPKPARSDRSETTPRGAAPRASRARARGGR